ncbi:unnamed protein product [Penicillium camemberti]|uniref:Str. FM013 n=1 Tax=Penicillium camemberti (strain FM 013) TaxID=1429867 RepID=A0A0G4NV42_PENC3|nr:unnamed protein product [Penicillium camemberti]
MVIPSARAPLMNACSAPGRHVDHFEEQPSLVSMDTHS